MKRMIIRAAENDALSAEDRLDDVLAVLKDNFNFATDGIEKIAADGDISGAIEKANALNELIDGVIGEIAGDIAE